ncbi:MAG: hypothetical protein NZM00_01160, partial [Anaerolinea sp.]|nr:hypothetical protein [Anaerolinea sp.]
QLDAAAVDALETLVQHALISDGRARWLEALRQIADQPPGEADPSDADDDDDRAGPDPRALTPERAAAIGAALARWFNRITPPPTGTTAEYVTWLEALIHPDPGELEDADAPDPDAEGVDHLDLPARIRMDGQPEAIRAALDDRISRDLAALAAFMGVLRGLRRADGLLSALGHGGGMLTWEQFYRALVNAVEAAAVERAPDRAGRVLITTVTEARGLPHDHVYIPGLSEGIFPAPAPTDPLLLDSERARLRAHGIDLALAAERADDDGLFFELLTLARRSLTFSRPTFNRGEAHLPGPLWDEARRLCPDAPVMRQRPGEPPAPADVCTLPEAALTAVYRLRRDERDPQALRVAAWVRAQPGDLWARIQAAGRIETRRMDRRAPPDRYSGRIEAAVLRDHLAERFGPAYRWSASALNLFG